jgi:MYXO-CTERM domain-containing protein
MKTPKLSILLLAAAVVAAVPSAQAALVTGWAKSQGAGPLTNASSASPTMGDGTANSADAMAIYASFPTIQLANVGDKVTMTAAVTLAGITNNAANHFRWSLYDVAGSPDLNGWLGYIAGNSTASVASNLWERANPNTALVMATNSPAATVISTSAAAGIGNDFTDSSFNLVFSLERTASGILISSSFVRISDSVQFGLHAFEDATPQTYSFNRVGFLASGNLDADQVQFSNIDVSVVPEPSAALLGGIGLLALLRRRRD